MLFRKQLGPRWPFRSGKFGLCVGTVESPCYWGDLSTIVQYKLPIKIVVFNNRSLGMVKLEMEVAGLPDWQTDMDNPDFALVAKAMRMEGFTVNDPDNV